MILEITTGIGIIKRKEIARKFGVGIQIFQASLGFLIIMFGVLLNIPELYLLGLAEIGLATFIILMLMRKNVVLQFSDSKSISEPTQRAVRSVGVVNNEKIRFECPSCGSKHSADPNQIGYKGKCKKCGHTIVVPKPSF